MSTRQIVLDTETTGRSAAAGHRIIEIGAVELLDRRITGNNFQYYINPERESEPEALKVHGITNEFLADKPLFAAIAEKFLNYIKDSELIIHNASFDLSFINSELKRWRPNTFDLQNRCIDTLQLARQLHPGQRNNLDALCKRYSINNQQRDLHGALLDAKLLANVYLAMTGGQVSLQLNEPIQQNQNLLKKNTLNNNLNLNQARPQLKIIHADQFVCNIHEKYLQAIQLSSKGKCVWLQD